jgi:hypothetical protein
MVMVSEDVQTFGSGIDIAFLVAYLRNARPQLVHLVCTIARRPGQFMSCTVVCGRAFLRQSHGTSWNKNFGDLDMIRCVVGYSLWVAASLCSPIQSELLAAAAPDK